MMNSAYYNCSCGNVFESDICFNGAICPKCGRRTNQASPGEGMPDLSVRSYNILKRAGISGMEELLGISDEELWQLRGMTQGSFDELSRYRQYFYRLQEETGLERKDWESVSEYLKSFSEPVPKWLREFRVGDSVDVRKALSNSRIVYSPDSTVDRKAIDPFLRARYAHVFLYAISSFCREQYQESLQAEGLEGYHVLQSSPFRFDTLLPMDWKIHEGSLKEKKSAMDMNDATGEITIFEKDRNGEEATGCERFVVIHLCADGAVAYDALFGNHICEIDTMFLKGHGYRNGYVMHSIAYETGAYPEYMMSIADTGWFCYAGFGSLNAVVGSKPNERWHLYKKTED